MLTNRHIAYPRRQRGVALVVALILLVVITLVGLAAVGGTIMQNKMAANQYDRQISFQNTTTALRQAGAWVTEHPNSTAIILCKDRADTDPCLANPFADGNVASTSYQSVTAVDALATTAQYVVEELPPPNLSGGVGEGCSTFNSEQRGGDLAGGCLGKALPGKYYRITARSGDPAVIGDRALVTLQSVIHVTAN